MLEFITDELFRGAPPPKEYTIGVQVFGRPEDFDPRVDAIVRVEASRLRARLKEYYEGNGKDDHIVIELPRGNYAPVFRLRNAPVASEDVADGLRDGVEIKTFVSRLRTPLIAAALLISVIVAVVLLKMPYEKRRPPEILRFTSDPGVTREPALSPDGTLASYVSDRSGEGNLDIWVRRMAGGEPIRLTHGPGDHHTPQFSADANRIVYRSESDDALYLIPALGGEPHLVARHGVRPRFSPDGRSIAYSSTSEPSRRNIFIAPTDGGTPRLLDTGMPLASDPIWSSDGKRLLFVGGKALTRPPWKGVDWYVIPAEGGAPLPCHVNDVFAGLNAIPYLGSDWITPDAWVRGNVYFSAKVGDATNIWWLPIAESNGRIAGPAQRLTFGAGEDIDVALARTPGGGLRAAFSIFSEEVKLWSAPVDPRSGLLTGDPQRLPREHTTDDFLPSLTPDGSQLVFIDTRSGFAGNIRVINLDTHREHALTDSPGDKATPILNRSGTEVAYSVQEGQPYNIFVQEAENGVARQVCVDCGRLQDWLPDERLLVSVPGGVRALDTRSGALPDLFRHPGYLFNQVRCSTDGHWLVAHGRFARTPQIVAIPLKGNQTAPEAEWVTVVDRPGNFIPRWSIDGRVVYFVSQRDGFRCLWAQRVDGISKRPRGDAFPVYHVHQSGIPGPRRQVFMYDVSQNRMVLDMDQQAGNVWLADVDVR